MFPLYNKHSSLCVFTSEKKEGKPERYRIHHAQSHYNAATVAFYSASDTFFKGYVHILMGT